MSDYSLIKQFGYFALIEAILRFLIEEVQYMLREQFIELEVQSLNSLPTIQLFSLFLNL